MIIRLFLKKMHAVKISTISYLLWKEPPLLRRFHSAIKTIQIYRKKAVTKSFLQKKYIKLYVFFHFDVFERKIHKLPQPRPLFQKNP